MGKQIGSNKSGKKKNQPGSNSDLSRRSLCFQHPQNLSAVFIPLACVFEGSFSVSLHFFLVLQLFLLCVRVCVCWGPYEKNSEEQVQGSNSGCQVCRTRVLPPGSSSLLFQLIQHSHSLCSGIHSIIIHNAHKVKITQEFIKGWMDKLWDSHVGEQNSA